VPSSDGADEEEEEEAAVAEAFLAPLSSRGGDDALLRCSLAQLKSGMVMVFALSLRGLLRFLKSAALIIAPACKPLRFYRLVVACCTLQ
jgi:hypothetical protein